MISMLTQMQALSVCLPAVETRPRESRRGVALGTQVRAIYDLLGDGKVWHSSAVMAALEIPLSSARSGLRRLEARELVACVGEERVPGNSAPRRLFRRTEFTTKPSEKK